MFVCHVKEWIDPYLVKIYQDAKFGSKSCHEHMYSEITRSLFYPTTISRFVLHVNTDRHAGRQQERRSSGGK